MSSIDPARRVAAHVLARVAAEGAWASPTLDAELSRSHLAPDAVGRATDLVYGSLRTLPLLDRALDAQRERKGPLDPRAHAILRSAIYQLQFTRAPSYAIVKDSVALVREARGEGLARFANAVLRRIAEKRPAEPVPPTRVEVPEWVERAIERSLGGERAQAFLGARPLPPPIALRVSTHRTTRDALIARLREARPHAQIEAGSLVDASILVRGAGDPRRLPGYDEGLFAVQDEGSQLVAALLGAQPGEKVADVCAGHGGKTAVLAAAVGPSGSITAIDVADRKLEAIQPELARVGIATPLETMAIDLEVGDGGLAGRFDRVLVDAPCTGLGTLHRRPELLLRLGPEDPARMAALQLAIVSRAASLVRPGGVLAVAVCSWAHEEGPGLADALAKLHPELARDHSPVPGVSAVPDADGVIRVGPWLDRAGSADGYQVVRFRRRD